MSLRTATPAGDCFSVAVASSGQYGAPEGLQFGFPVAADGKGGWSVVEGFTHDDFAAERIKITTDELDGRAQRRQGAGPHRLSRVARPGATAGLDPQGRGRPAPAPAPAPRPGLPSRAVRSRETAAKHMAGTLRPVGDLFDGYGASTHGLTEAAFDEMVGRDGEARVPYAAVASSLAQMGPEDVSARASRLARAFMDQGVTFDLDGEERPFPLDVVPRIFTAAEWTRVADGVAQRVRALELFLADVYGAARIVSDGLIPHEVVTSSPGFVRAAFGYTPPNGVRIHVAGIDVIRDEDGEFRVLEDNLRSPSGVSYVLANRAAMARVLPELFWGQPIQMVTDYPARLISALRRAAPASVQDPTVVVLTPGVHNSAFYEHALLAPPHGGAPGRGS